MKKFVFLGLLYPYEREDEIRENMIVNISNAPNVFQWNLLHGIQKLVGSKLSVVNVLPVGIWKRQYRKFFLNDSEWKSKGVSGHEIGSINLPFLKQWHRSVKIKKYLKKAADGNTEIILYSAYMPFLKAVYKLPKNIKITAIITDLPDYYDLGQTSSIRKFLRSVQNRMIKRYLKRIDRFVVLTKQMCEPLEVGDRPWVCVEGICDAEQKVMSNEKNDKHIIFYSGTLHYQYGIKNLLDAFSLMENENIQLWICGGGEAKAEIESLVQKDNRVKFYGFCTQSEVAELRNQADILVNPRPNEGEYVKYSFPSKTMEYMASGKPVVMYKLDGIPDEYDSYLNYVNPFGDKSTQLAATLQEVIYKYDDALKKAEEARAFVIKNKNAVSQAKKILDLTGVINE